MAGYVANDQHEVLTARGRGVYSMSRHSHNAAAYRWTDGTDRQT